MTFTTNYNSLYRVRTVGLIENQKSLSNGMKFSSRKAWRVNVFNGMVK
jgi:hypothetical protein